MLEKICEVSVLKKGRAMTFRINGKQIAVFFDGEKVFAFSPFCPHARANLTKGFFQGHEVKCHWHGWRFNLENGKGLNNDSCLTLYEASVREGIVFVELPEAAEDEVTSFSGEEDFFMPEIKWKND